MHPELDPSLDIYSEPLPDTLRTDALMQRAGDRDRLMRKLGRAGLLAGEQGRFVAYDYEGQFLAFCSQEAVGDMAARYRDQVAGFLKISALDAANSRDNLRTEEDIEVGAGLEFEHIIDRTIYDMLRKGLLEGRIGQIMAFSHTGKFLGFIESRKEMWKAFADFPGQIGSLHTVTFDQHDLASAADAETSATTADRSGEIALLAQQLINLGQLPEGHGIAYSPDGSFTGIVNPLQLNPGEETLHLWLPPTPEARQSPHPPS
ncbi:MAG: hypothetical protein V1908_02760 [Candidatus Peregrinibacteria bacterium]